MNFGFILYVFLLILFSVSYIFSRSERNYDNKFFIDDKHSNS